ncbi:MAG TPA: hypothetical protein VFS50_04465 [Meiothermus sp.]|nr:hypothetical protein [Meiothermus sp.]
MTRSRTLLIALLSALSFATAQGILPQSEPEQVILQAVSDARRGAEAITLGSALPPGNRNLLAAAQPTQVIPYRQPLWTPSAREYKLLTRTKTLYVQVNRQGTGPWQVVRVSTAPEPKVFVPSGELIGNAPVEVRASGFPAGERVQVRIAPPNMGAGAALAAAQVKQDGTALLFFVMPAVLSLPAQQVKTVSGATLRVPAQDRAILESPQVILVSTRGGRSKATTAVPYRPRLSERDLTARYEGALAFSYLRGEQVRAQADTLEVFEVGAFDAVTVMQARRYPRNPSGPANPAEYVQRLLELHPDTLMPFPEGTPKVEGEVETPDGRAWRLWVQGEFGDRPVYVLFRGSEVWIVQGNPQHAPVLDAMVRTLEVRR